jgi:hypothetical protein
MTCPAVAAFHSLAPKVSEIHSARKQKESTRLPDATKSSFEEALMDVWRQTLVDSAKTVTVSGKSYRVLKTPKKGLRQVDFVFDGREIRGLEQNPDTNSRWAQLAASGVKVMQFLSEGRYIAAVCDGKLTLYK